MVADGTFRQDLYYRLNVVRIEIPALRERPEDIPLLAQHLLEKHRRREARVQGFSPQALGHLCRQPWPGNVRELENAIEAALALAPGERLECGDFPAAAAALVPRPSPSSGGQDVPLSLDAYERLALERALDETGGDASEAARRLGIGRSTLYRKLAKHGIEVRRRDRPGRTILGGLEAVG
ncbi:MAG: hypothetical protein CL910_09500 [Deltaproteobacteria bacterium]|nr:hypothetical protein [Deltaproteobacteria bacterium]